MKRIRVEEIDGVIYIDGVDIIKKLSELSKENDRLFLENKKQEDKIEKALEYIYDRFEIVEETGEYHFTHTFSLENVKELYDILKNN